MARYRIHKNVWDNWYGYEGTRRVEAFSNTPYASAEENAKEWLREKTKHQHTCPQCGVTLTCNNPVDCPGVGKPALCGACPDETNADMWERSK